MLKKISVSILIGILIVHFGYIMAVNESFPEWKISYNELPKQTQKQISCLADNIFFEAAYEPDKGKVAVAFVTLNRVYSSNYPDDICSVVKQKARNVCQFSWYCEDTPKRISYTKSLTRAQEMVYNDIRDLAIYVYLNYEKLEDPTKGALFYHADYVNPYWNKHKVKTTKIGRHIFYVRKETI
jgi:N-acetylmuramoyl-L-alanine amidase